MDILLYDMLVLFSSMKHTDKIYTVNNSVQIYDKCIMQFISSNDLKVTKNTGTTFAQYYMSKYLKKIPMMISNMS